MFRPHLSPFVALASTTNLVYAQDGHMMNWRGWYGGWMGGYGGVWMTILLVLIVGLLVWIVIRKRK